MGIDAVGFCGKYQLNANQEMHDQRACLRRDYMLGAACGYAKNGDIIAKQLLDFYNGQYNNDNYAPFNIVLDLPDEMDAQFEENMNKVGQEFDKLA